MRSSGIVALGSLLLVAVHVRPVTAHPPTDAQAHKEPPRGYTSPGEVYDAWRRACDEGDWRTVFFCLTPSAQDAAVFGKFDEAIFNTHNNPKVRAILKKYGLEFSSVEEEYRKEYSKKYNYEFPKPPPAPKALPRREPALPIVPAPPGTPPPPPTPDLPPLDYTIFCEVVLRRVTDKAGFYQEASKALAPKVKPWRSLQPDYGDLTELRISGDTARGRVFVTCYHLAGGFESGPSGLEKTASTPYRETFCFRKIEGKWFLVGVIPPNKSEILTAPTGRPESR